jgi:hypothetical protein
MWHAWERREKCPRFWWESPKERDHLEDQGVFGLNRPLPSDARSQVSSVSIVSDYGLDDRAFGVRSSAGEKDFSSILCVQTGSGAHPASCTMGTRGPFPGGKALPVRDADHSPPSSAEVVNE